MLTVVIRKLFDYLPPARYTNFDKDDPSSHSHYGLNFPLYTHFTSPIRRYADLLVHRLVTECLKGPDDLLKDNDDYEHLCRLCSDKSLSSKRASRQC